VLRGAAPQWAIARELGVLSGNLSPEVRAALARAGRTGELDVAMDSLREIGERNRSEGKRNAQILRLVGRPFSAKAAAALAPWRWGSGSGRRVFTTRVWFIFVVASSLLRGLASTCSTTPDPTTSTVQPPWVVRQAIRLAAEKADALIGQAADVGEGVVADEARAVRAALLGNDCRHE